MQPRTETAQRCLSFQLSVYPRARVASFRDYLGNSVHHFDVPGLHRQLVIVAEAIVDVTPPPNLPASLPADSWSQLDRMIAEGDYWEFLMPSHFARSGASFRDFAAELGCDSRQAAREREPLSLLLEINDKLSSAIAYTPKSTSVDSPIELAIRNRQGVCQDFAHIMITLLRSLGIPARYVSGYMFHRSGEETRSTEGATHAWVEALLPELGWVGFDPTNQMLVDGRHVRTAVGRDYADVPPSKGVFKGSVESELTVLVRVAPSDAPPSLDDDIGPSEEWPSVAEELPDIHDRDLVAEQQQQQQQ